MKTKGLIWYKFQIYFGVWLSAAWYIYNGVLSMSGISYSEDGMNADMVYAMYKGLSECDVFYGFFNILLGIYAVFVRFALAGKKKNAPLMLSVMYTTDIFLLFLYAVGVAVTTGAQIFESTLILIALPLILIIVNSIYFSSRKQMFS